MHKIIGITESVEKWGVYELALEGPSKGNPFFDTLFGARFRGNGEDIRVSGFYDGDGIYRVRFMPSSEGEWTVTTYANHSELDGYESVFTAVAPGKGNRGPVEVRDTYHFAYKDGTPYYPLGSTSYGWAHQSDETAARTLDALSAGGFNKFRTGIMPHYSEYSQSAATCYPFAGSPPANWDFSRFDPAYFQMMEKRILGLMERGIEADLILFHPYSGPWDLERLPPWADEAYVRYCVSRFAAFRNVWWSLANEYDLLKEKSVDDWHNLCRLTADEDPYGHLLSIHNGVRLYEFWKPWITHACVQDGLAVEIPGRAFALRNAYHKPVVYDEVCYEGNFDARWGDLSGQEMVRRFWEGAISGTYVGHGEVIETEESGPEEVWTAVGGELRGESAPRIRFLRRILEEFDGCGWEPVDPWWHKGIAQKGGKVFLAYLGEDTPEKWDLLIPEKNLILPEGSEFRLELIDTWNMTVEALEGVFALEKVDQYFYGVKGGVSIELPPRPYLALRIIALA